MSKKVVKKDLPRYKAVREYEKIFKISYALGLSKIFKTIINKL